MEQIVIGACLDDIIINKSVGILDFVDWIKNGFVVGVVGVLVVNPKDGYMLISSW